MTKMTKKVIASSIEQYKKASIYWANKDKEIQQEYLESVKELEALIK